MYEGNWKCFLLLVTDFVQNFLGAAAAAAAAAAELTTAVLAEAAE